MFDLIELKAQEVHLARSAVFVPAERGDAIVEYTQARSKDTQGLEINVRENVERIALRLLIQERLMVVLAVEIDERTPSVFERADRYHAPIELGT
jgi:hypothetical protein